MHESSGDLHTYREALEVLLSSVRCCLQSQYVELMPWESTKGSLSQVPPHVLFTNLMCPLLSYCVHSNAEKAENQALCVAAARHYWNACLPLTQTAEERRQLQEPLEKILTALIKTKKQTDVGTLLHSNP